MTGHLARDVLQKATLRPQCFFSRRHRYHARLLSTLRASRRKLHNALLTSGRRNRALRTAGAECPAKVMEVTLMRPIHGNL